LKYLEHMSKFASAGFLSINQEAAADNLVGGRQGVVPKLIATYDSSFRRVWRSRDFLRAGYVEEFYRINWLAKVRLTEPPRVFRKPFAWVTLP
jgi:hypothetical protein